MVHELLMGGDTHLYRHDIESLFYIMLTVCGHYTIGYIDGGAGKMAKQRVVVREGKLPYQKWFDQHDRDTLGCLKVHFLYMGPIEFSPIFGDFRA